jgi:hypothetical protein
MKGESRSVGVVEKVGEQSARQQTGWKVLSLALYQMKIRGLDYLVSTDALFLLVILL